MFIPSNNPETTALNVLPFSKRVSLVTGLVLKRWISWFKGISGEAVRQNKIFTDYINGSIYNFWNIAVTYNKGQRVNTKFGTFEALESNVGVFPQGSDKWMLLNKFIIGSIERTRFNGTRIVLEKALNHQFQKELSDNGLTGFKQPTSYSGTGQLPLSDIYITTVTVVLSSFVSFTDNGSDSFTINSGSNYSFTDETYSVDTTYNYNIHVPVSVSLTIGIEYDKIIRNFVDLYNMTGTQYTIILY